MCQKYFSTISFKKRFYTASSVQIICKMSCLMFIRWMMRKCDMMWYIKKDDVMTYAQFALMWDEENGRFNTQLEGIMAIAFCQLY